jgi:mannitol-1-phosphate/altronate dehydrogenase
MYSKNGILKVIGKPNNRATMVVNMHNTNDIIAQMQNAHYENSAYAKKIANRFRGSSTKQTCRNIYNRQPCKLPKHCKD